MRRRKRMSKGIVREKSRSEGMMSGRSVIVYDEEGECSLIRLCF